MSKQPIKGSPEWKAAKADAKAALDKGTWTEEFAKPAKAKAKKDE
jgi:hypothetical protein